MAILPSQSERNADDMRLRIISFCGKKTDRGVEKSMITKEEAELLYNRIDKLLYKFKKDWWLDRHGCKSYDTIMLMLTETDNNEKYIEILQKIEKA